MRPGTVHDLILVRHGTTDYNQQKRFMGQRDIPLNSEGRNQAKRAATAIHHLFPFIETWECTDVTLLTSDLARCRDTLGTIVSCIFPRDITWPIHSLEQLREIDVGSWAGYTFDEIEGDDPIATQSFFRQYSMNPKTTPYPQGESQSMVIQRLVPVTACFTDRRYTILCSHSGTLSILIEMLTGHVASKIELGAIVVLSYKQGQWFLRSPNPKSL